MRNQRVASGFPTKSARSPRPSPALRALDGTEPALSIYDGRTCVGTVIELQGDWHAFDLNGNHLGSFAKRQTAVAAFSRSAEAGNVA